jgi:hypothetical protein
MPDNRAPVRLRCEITINGRTYAVDQPVPRNVWDGYEEWFRAGMQATLREHLIRMVIQREDPAVTVHIPDEREDALYQQADEATDA